MADIEKINENSPSEKTMYIADMYGKRWYGVYINHRSVPYLIGKQDKEWIISRDFISITKRGFKTKKSALSYIRGLMVLSI